MQVTTKTDRRRFLLSNKLSNETGEGLETRRAQQLLEDEERHNKMCDKVRLEALTLSNRQNTMADEIFQSGQSILSGIVKKTRNVDERRTENIQNLKDQRA